VPGPLLGAFAVLPERPDTVSQAIFVAGAYIGSADQTVQFVAVYVNPAAAKDLAGGQALARKILATLAAGSGSLKLSSGERRLPVPGGKQDLAVTVPEGVVALTQAGPDFLVHKLKVLTRLGEPGASVGLYIGGHPAYQFKQIGSGKIKATESKGTLLGKQIAWQTWSAEGATTGEVILPLPEDPGDSLHVFCMAASLEKVDQLRRMVSTLRLVPK
jgi:hypothetical protein